MAMSDSATHAASTIHNSARLGHFGDDSFSPSEWVPPAEQARPELAPLTPLTPPTPLVFWSVKVSQLAEDLEPRIYLRAAQLLQPLRAEALASKRSHHAAVKHRAPKGPRRQLFLRSKIPEESPRK